MEIAHAGVTRPQDLKVLLCHTYYQQRGGEDESFEAEAALLEARGHQTVRFTRHNDEIAAMSGLTIARKAIWNGAVHDELRAVIRRERPQIVHCTNTFPLLSPAVYYAARAEGVPVVQSLRNYRLLCPSAVLLRDERVCEDCLGRPFAWPGILHACYRNSRAATAVVAGMTALHRSVGTWTRTVSHYFTCTEFARRKFIEGGFPADRLTVKPNFVDPDPGPRQGAGEYAIFVGRLVPEKGIATLLSAWSRLRGGQRLKIVGDGPMADEVRAAAAADDSIEWMGRRSLDEVLVLVGDAACLVMPSIWYETFGRTIIEAFARGTPVIASRLGAMAELVRDGETGLLAEPGNAIDLAATIDRFFEQRAAWPSMRVAARQQFEAKYTAESNYPQLMAIYERAAIATRAAGAVAGGIR